MRHPRTLLNLTVLEPFLQVDRIYEGRGGVLQNDQLMGNDPIDDLLFLRLGDVVDTASLVQLCLAATVPFVAVEHLIHGHSLVAAWILVLGAVRLD